MSRGKPKLTALWHALDEATFGPERTLNLRESLPSAVEARARTDAWLRTRQVTKAEEVLIITGRGNQSVGGVGIIRREILAMMPSLRKRGIVESWREHSPGSLVVQLAPTSALFAAAKRRRGTEGNSQSGGGSIAGLERETVALLRQLALNNLDSLGVENDEAFIRAEMERAYSILANAIAEKGRSEEALKSAIRNAIDEGLGDAGNHER